MDLDSFLVSLYVLVDDWWRPTTPRSAARTSCPAQRPGGPHPGDPRPVAPLPQREGLLALRFFAPALLLP